MATPTATPDAPAAGGRAPTLEDAKVGAEVLRAAGARKVIAFGSIARGEQTEDSDLDLAAIFDDIDYDRRRGMRFDLCKQVVDATGFDADVLLTDFPEWNRRVRNVPTCLEAVVAAYGTVLISEPPLQSQWRHKEMVLAMSPQSEALDRLNDVASQLDAAVLLVDDINALLATEPTTSAEANEVRVTTNARRRRLLGHLHLAYEAALKALLAQHSDSPPRVHKTDELEDRLPEPHRTVALRIRGRLQHREIQYRHVEANYFGRTRRPEEELTASTPTVAAAGVAISEYAAEQYELVFGPCAETALVLRHVAEVRERQGNAPIPDWPSSGEGG